jgi:hypothetical protein
MKLSMLCGFVCVAYAVIGCADGSATAPGGSGGSGEEGGGGSSGTPGNEGGGGSENQGSGGSGGSGNQGGGGFGGGTLVDECAAGTAGCDVNAACTDLPDGFRCECNPGYAGSGVMCADVDECAEDISDCDPAATCANNEGGFTCACPGGYEDTSGDGTVCTDIDECATGADDCDPTATCANNEGGFTCACPAGYEDTSGDGTVCTDIDECATGADDCDAVALCSNTDGDFTCACPPGFNDPNGDGTLCISSDPLGDTCSNPLVVNPLALPITVTGDTASALPEYGYGAGQCPGETVSAGAGSNDEVYRLTPTVSSAYTFALTSTAFDSSVYIVTDCGAIATSCVGAKNAACSGCTETLTAQLTAGTSYFIVVDGSSDASNDAGAYSLQISRVSSPTNPVQFDVTSELLHDTIVNNGAGALDTIQTAIDGSDFKLMTQSAARMFSSAGVGLPDDAFFAANAQHPNIQLHWNNNDDGLNSRFMNAGESFTFPVPATTYGQVQVYGLSTEGSSTLQFTLAYSDGTSDSRLITFVDWFNDPAPFGQFYIIDGMDRYAASYVAARDPAITGVNLSPNSAKTLTSVTVAQPTTSFFVFLGALGY